MSEPERPPTPPRLGGLPIGRIWGIPVVVQPLWFLIVVIFTVTLAPTVRDNVDGLTNNASYALALIFVLVIYASVFLHELGHSYVARGLGMQVRRIVLQFLGGASEIVEEFPGTPAREFMVAMAGPLTSVLLAAIGFGLAPIFADHSVGKLLTAGFGYANAVVVVFNLLPGMPLDGGRLLQAVVWRLTGDKTKARLLAGWIGRGIAVVVAGYGVYALGTPVHAGRDQISGYYPLFLALFLWTSASTVIAQSKVSRILPRLDLAGLTRAALAVTADLPVAEAVRRAREAAVRAVVVVDSYGHPSGLVSEAAVSALTAQRQPWVPVSDLARPLVPGLVLRTDMSGDSLLRAVQVTPATEYLVLDPSGTLRGVLARQDLVAALQAAGLR